MISPADRLPEARRCRPGPGRDRTRGGGTSRGL